MMRYIYVTVDGSLWRMTRKSYLAYLDAGRKIDEYPNLEQFGVCLATNLRNGNDLTQTGFENAYRYELADRKGI